MQSLRMLYDIRVISNSGGIVEIGLAGIIGHDIRVIVGWVSDLLSPRFACYAHVGIGDALSITMTTQSTTDQIANIAAAIARCSPNVGTFAQSLDEIDRMVAGAIRRRAVELAESLVGASSEDIDAAHAALVVACSGDMWATAQIAKRFRSALLRFELVRAISRHPRAVRFSSLTEAISRGRYTRKQLAFAKRLAAEVAA